MEPDDLLNKALVAYRHRMGERIARQDRDGSYRDRKAGHERPVSPSPSVVEKPSGHPLGLARPRPYVTERPPTHVLTLSSGRGYGQDMPDDHLHQTHPDIVKRLKHAHGHPRSVIERVESRRPCLDIAQQIGRAHV